MFLFKYISDVCDLLSEEEVYLSAGSQGIVTQSPVIVFDEAATRTLVNGLQVI